MNREAIRVLSRGSLYSQGESGCAVAEFRLLGTNKVSAMVKINKIHNV